MRRRRRKEYKGGGLHRGKGLPHAVRRGARREGTAGRRSEIEATSI